MAYGSDYSAVQSADLAEQAARRAALQNSYQNMVRGGEFAATEAARRRGEALAAQRLAQDQQAIDQNFYFQNERQITADEERKRRAQLDEDYFKFQKEQAGKPQVRDTAAALRTAYEFANQGEGDTPEYFTALGVAPEHAGPLYEHAQKVRGEYEQEYSNAQTIASTVNAYRAADRRIKELNDAITKGTHLFKNDPNVESWKTELEQQKAIQAKLKPNYDRINGDKSLARLVTPDPETGDLQVALPAPTWTRSTNVRSIRPPTSVAPAAIPAPTEALEPGLQEFNRRIGLTGTQIPGVTPASGIVPMATGYATDYATAAAPAARPVNNQAPLAPYSPQYTARVRQLMGSGLTLEQAIYQAKVKEGLR
jgi:hypothetical protein